MPDEIVVEGEDEAIEASVVEGLGDEVGGPLRTLKRGAKGVGRGAKKVGKGVVKVSKKGVNAATSPLGLTLLATAATGGVGILAAKTLLEAKKGNPNAIRALAFVKGKAKAGDPNARKVVSEVNHLQTNHAFTSVNRGVYRTTRYREGVRA